MSSDARCSVRGSGGRLRSRSSTPPRGFKARRDVSSIVVSVKESNGGRSRARKLTLAIFESKVMASVQYLPVWWHPSHGGRFRSPRWSSLCKAMAVGTGFIERSKVGTRETELPLSLQFGATDRQRFCPAAIQEGSPRVLRAHPQARGLPTDQSERAPTRRSRVPLGSDSRLDVVVLCFDRRECEITSTEMWQTWRKTSSCSVTTLRRTTWKDLR